MPGTHIYLDSHHENIASVASHILTGTSEILNHMYSSTKFFSLLARPRATQVSVCPSSLIASLRPLFAPSSHASRSVPYQKRSYASIPPDTSASLSAITPPRKKIIVAMTGATGCILGIKILKSLRKLGVETHLIMSKWAEATIKYETDYQPIDIRGMADFC